MKRVALIAIALAASTTVANAYDYSRSGRIDAREAAQAHRIERAARHGQLTWYERMALAREQAHIYRMERAAKRDGYISGEEARRIERAQDAASQHIYRERRPDVVAAAARVVVRNGAPAPRSTRRAAPKAALLAFARCC